MNLTMIFWEGYTQHSLQISNQLLWFDIYETMRVECATRIHLIMIIAVVWSMLITFDDRFCSVNHSTIYTKG